MNNLLETPIEYLKGVGPARGELLRKELGIHKYGDLINLFPNRYIDRTRYYKINELLNSNSEVQVVGKVINLKSVGEKRTRLVATLPMVPAKWNSYGSRGRNGYVRISRSMCRM